ncbi:Protein of unknown function [Kriegella aquimaris]|uniref:DUF2911 domain-containing protein n=2 Tax=Kriegella aquimaris TaxID=192904 RepID=A0A1G9RH18_9FLAO|nr:Protein of unknown function [Kriegella aquimaris]
MEYYLVLAKSKIKIMKNLLTLTTLIITMVCFTETNAQKFDGLDKSPMDMATYPSSYKEPVKVVRVTYSRPQLKGRSLSQLAPNGKVWRTGANEAPEITFYKDVNFGGKPVKAGTYALFTIPGEKEWTFILNSNLNQWGAYSYDKAADVVRVNGSVSTNGESLDAFSIAFDEANGGATMLMGWDKARASLPITF